MKYFSLVFASVIFSSLIFIGCQDSNMIEPVSEFTTDNMVGGYTIELMGGAPVDNGDGTYTWTWGVTNTRPGNGKNGTFQNLSHWTFQPGACMTNGDIVSAAYGSSLENLTPVTDLTIKRDPSIGTCYTGDVFKFDNGTSGSVTTYYRLVINKNYVPDPNGIAYWKAGNACGQGIFTGIGCEPEPDPCTYEHHSAWAAGTRYTLQGNWATYTQYDGTAKTVTLFAGQTINAGSVTFSAPVNGQVTISVALNSNVMLTPGSESIHVQGYSIAPSGNPAPGQFTTYKGSNMSFTVPAFNFYGVHVNVEVCQ